MLPRQTCAKKNRQLTSHVFIRCLFCLLPSAVRLLQCLLAKEVPGIKYVNDFNAVMGPRECPRAFKAVGSTLDVHPHMSTWSLPNAKPYGRWVTWYPTSVPGWRPALPALAADGDPATCFTLPAGEHMRALVLDLGRAMDIEAVEVDTGGTDTADFKVYAGPTLASVGGGYNTPNGGQMPAPPGGETLCGNGKQFSVRTGADPWSAGNKYFRPSAAVLRVPCAKQKVRYVSVVALERRAFYKLCEVRAEHHKGNTWKAADRSVLPAPFFVCIPSTIALIRTALFVGGFGLLPAACCMLPAACCAGAGSLGARPPMPDMTLGYVPPLAPPPSAGSSSSPTSTSGSRARAREARTSAGWASG